MIGQIVGTVMTVVLVVVTYAFAAERERTKTWKRLMALMDKARKREGVATVTCLEILDAFGIKE